MSIQIQFRRGTTAEHSTFTGAVGEVTVDTDKDTVVVHDGATAGGKVMLREDQSNLPTSAPTTGIYNNSGALALSTNGTGRLFVDASGRVGVGTSTFGAANHVLTVAGGYCVFNGLRVNGTDTANSIYQAAAFGLSSDNYITIGTGASQTERLRITAAGLVGIGTSDPTSGTSSYYDDLVIKNNTSGSGAGITIQSNSTNGFSGLNLRKADGTDLGKFVAESSNGKLYIEAAGSAAITVDSSQRVGIGTTSPSAKLHVDGNALFANTANNLEISLDSTYSTILDAQLTGASEMFVLRTNRGIKFDTGGSTERLRIDSSGRILVGTSSVIGVGNDLFVLKGTAVADASFYLGRNANASTISDGNALGYIKFGGGDGGEAARIIGVADGTWSSTSDCPGRLVFSTTADGASSPTERMRINNIGAVSINTQGSVLGNAILSVASGGSGHAASFKSLQTTGTVANVIFYDGDNTDCGSIDINTTANTTAYTTSSDYRLKTKIQPLDSGIQRLLQLKPCKWEWLSAPGVTGEGFIAHEAQEVVPEAVTGFKDENDENGNPVYQGIDQSKLVPLLTAALQEVIGEIESLKAEVAALKAQ